MFPLLAAKLWKPVAIALLIAAALGYRALLLHQRDAARAEAAHLSASLADAEASNAALQSAIATQNSAVAQLRAELEQACRPRRRASARRRRRERRRCARRRAARGRLRVRGSTPAARRRSDGATRRRRSWADGDAQPRRRETSVVNAALPSEPSPAWFAGEGVGEGPLKRGYLFLSHATSDKRNAAGGRQIEMYQASTAHRPSAAKRRPRRRGASVGERSAAKGPSPYPLPRTIAGEGMKGKRTVDANVSEKSGERAGRCQSDLHWAAGASSRSRRAVSGPLPYPLLGQGEGVRRSSDASVGESSDPHARSRVCARRMRRRHGARAHGTSADGAGAGAARDPVSGASARRPRAADRRAASPNRRQPTRCARMRRRWRS